MLQCRKSLITLLAIGQTLLAGCGTATHSPKTSTQPENRDRPFTRKNVAASGDRSTRNLAEAHAHYAAGVIHDINDEPDQALEEFYKAAMADVGDERLVLDLSRRLLQAKKTDKALEVLTKATALPGASGTLFARLGLVYAQLDKNEAAISANQAAIKKSPRALAGYQNLFDVQMKSGQHAEALKTLERAAKQPDTDAVFLLGLVELCNGFGRAVPEKKDTLKPLELEVLNRAAKLNPANPNLSLKLADGLNLMGEIRKATEIYLQLLSKYGDFPPVRDEIRAKLTDIYLRGSNRERAVEQLEAMVRDDPANAQAYYHLGGLAYEEKKFDQAAEYFEKTLLFRPDIQQAYYDLAGVQINLNKTQDALATLDKARTKFPENFVTEFLSGLAYNRRKDYATAIKHFTAAEVIARVTDPKRLNQAFYFQLGAVYERNGDYQQAETYFQKCLEMSPNFAEALNYLGYMWADRGVKLEKAHELIEKAVKLEPKNAAFLDSLGWVLFKLNQPQPALEQILKAVEFAEEPDATLYDHLGDIYTALKQPEKAREAWHKSLAIEPNDQIQKKLGPPAAR
ncbi:MAG: tetratricopeptide repeat protein [Verrucomicrobia bacterium]|nr:tetratricopeptide repeat protein [Verrucomicrobiota bacterium]